MHSDLKSAEVSTVVLIGAPNSGKTTLYNWITGSNARTVNYPGSTVEYSVGKSLPIYGPEVQIIDTPGTYSLFPKTPDEEVTRKVLSGVSTKIPNVALVVVDLTQFTRHMALVAQVREAGFFVVAALTMRDIIEKEGNALILGNIEATLGVPAVPIDGRLGGGVRELMQNVQRLVQEEHIQRNSAEKTESTPFIKAEWSTKEFTEHVKKFEEMKKNIFSSIDTTTPVGGSSKILTEKIDRFLLHPAAGLLVFILIMGLLFTSIFWLAHPITELIDIFFSKSAEYILSFAPGQLWSEFLADGVLGGLGAFLVFVPQIFILHFGLTLLEDTGYLARAATLMDKPLSFIGLNGRCFVPMLSGFACAVPAIMATRTIPNRRERWLTILILPLMTCSARIPVYVLLLAFLFQGEPSWKAGVALTAVYFSSLFLGAVVSAFLNHILKKDKLSFFILELPHYRKPKLINVLRTAYNFTRSFVWRAGPVIFVLALIVWGLSTFPNYQLSDTNERIHNSYMAHIGQFIEPAMEPLGLDWRVGVGIISSFAAREVFVSTMAIMFNAAEDKDSQIQASLLKSMKNATNNLGQPIFTTASIIGLFVFYMIALQCMATVAIMRKETGNWIFPLSQVFVLTIAAYTFSVLAVGLLRSIGIS